MRFTIEASLNTDLYNIATSSVNGGSKSELNGKLRELLDEIPVGRYILAVGERGYNTGYQKISSTIFKWMYNNDKKDILSYWDTSDSYIVLPSDFEPTSKIRYEDDIVQVYRLFNSDDEIYRGEEDYEPMKKEDWKFCKDLKLYYIVDYMKHTTYIKWKVEN